ncbi:MAG: ATP-binding protein [Sphingobium sp.]
MNDATPPHLIASLMVTAVAIVAAALMGLGWAGAGIVALTAAILISLHMDRVDEVGGAAPFASAKSSDLLHDESFARILDGLNEPMMMIDRGKVALANAAALRLLGGHIVGEDVRIAIRHPAVAQRLAGLERIDGPATIDIVGLGTRSQRWTMQIVPIDRSDEAAQRLMVHLVDHSGQYAAERMRVDFVANASHELRTPLAAILGYIETLEDPKAGGDAQIRNRFLKIVDGEARRMQQLVDDLMSLSRIEADKHRLPDGEIDLAQLVQEVIHVTRASLGPRGADVVGNIATGVAGVQGDRAQLSQVLHNLVSNSAKYGWADTPITVSLSPAPPSMVRIEVRDEGDGIDPDHLPRLTERFYRVDSGRSRALGGTGLGLAIVKHIVERHRGRLDISSILGKGTTISVLLPAYDAATTGPQGDGDLAAMSSK